MKSKNLIEVSEFCDNHGIEVSFLNKLQEFGLVEILMIGDYRFLSQKELPKLEFILLFRQELLDNLGDVEVILNLLDRIHQIQYEAGILSKKLQMT